MREISAKVPQKPGQYASPSRPVSTSATAAIMAISRIIHSPSISRKIARDDDRRTLHLQAMHRHRELYLSGFTLND
jgi:hypothetical protein